MSLIHLHLTNTANLKNTNVYKYENELWEDQLTEINGEEITYDKLGNPLSIGNKKLEWINSNQLSKYNDGDLNIDYRYDNEGLRITKNIGDVHHNYYYEGKNLIFDECSRNLLYFIRDDKDRLIAFKYNDDLYYYIKNAQEDIIGIVDSEFNTICNYEYDSWGRIISIKNADGNEIVDKNDIAYINPFRYRSYYYDDETELYYLSGRYYNPSWGRFINPDIYISTDLGMNSTNMYAYTENNPVNRTDKYGEFWFQVAGATIGAVVNVGFTIASNISHGERIDKNLGKSLASGALTGLIATTPIGFTPAGAALSAFGTAFIESDEDNIGDRLMDTAINGTINMAVDKIAPSVRVQKNWIRPTKFVTSFTGNYIKRIGINITSSAIVSNSLKFASEAIKVVKGVNSGIKGAAKTIKNTYKSVKKTIKNVLNKLLKKK